MDYGYTTSDRTSSDSSFSSPPYYTLSTSKNQRKDDPSHQSFLLKRNFLFFVKTVNLLGLPEGFEILTPIEYQRANNPPAGCVIVYAAQCVSGLRLMFIHDKPSSYEAWKNRFFFVQKAEWEVPLVWRSSLNDLPSINFELLNERVKAAGPLDHGFKANALVEEDLLIVAGLHPIPDTYTGLESRYFRLPAVRKFLSENVPSNPLSSSSTTSASATPSDIQSSGRGQSPSRTPLVVGPSSSSPSPTPTGYVNPSSESPVIEVETSPEGDTTPAPSSPPFVLLSEVGSCSQKRSRVEEAPQVEEAFLSDPTQAAASASFPLPVMTPQFNPKVGVSNMCKVANKSDVEFLSGRSMESLGHLIL
ncbi:hypothetical protein Salat_0834100 [Sesamum alatum]|uniref:Uncharacterized protein n=1 Tax=Sesamum alatum TaxID=300844 RepID=A0AAE1YIA4_9LAMI|nr:hypothetical protein Salat_0834100 [Sesamum alatum]